MFKLSKRKIFNWKAVLVFAVFLIAVMSIAAMRETLTVKTLYANAIRALKVGGTGEYSLTLGRMDDSLIVSADHLVFRSRHPAIQNLAHNTKLSVWSGASCSATAAAAAPEGWHLRDPGNTGATLYRWGDDPVIAGADDTVSQELIASAGTPYAHLGNAMQWQLHGTIDGIADEIEYMSAVSTDANWINRWVGQDIQWGFLIYTDPVGAGTSNVFRPYIVTCTNTITTAGVTAFAAMGTGVSEPATGGITNYAWARGGWQWMSASTRVPLGATAVAFGIEGIQTTALTGESCFILGPTIVSGTTVGFPVPKHDEVIWLADTIDMFVSGGSTIGAGTALNYDISDSSTLLGRVSDDNQAMYVTIGGLFTGLEGGAIFRIYDKIDSGITIESQRSAISSYLTRTWIPIGVSGYVTFDTNPAGNAVSAASCYVHAVKALY